MNPIFRAVQGEPTRRQRVRSIIEDICGTATQVVFTLALIVVIVSLAVWAVRWAWGSG